jgi:hypothetical protein
MFTLKDAYEFGQLRRRESENVRAELTEKVLAYNIGQIIRVRERPARQKLEPSLSGLRVGWTNWNEKIQDECAEN